MCFLLLVSLFVSPFNSRNKYAITITRPVGLVNESPNKRQLLMKGAPEVILARCSHVMRRGEVKPIDERFKREFTEAYERFGNMGQRVLGFAMLDLPEDKFGAKFDSQFASNSEAIPTSGLVFVGLVSLVDPPKVTVPQAVLDCHSAGIKVIMVRPHAHTHTRHTLFLLFSFVAADDRNICYSRVVPSKSRR